jgi:hypothetical protein
MAVKKIAHPSVDERRAKGKEVREQTVLSSHAGWRPAADRPDPVALLRIKEATASVLEAHLPKSRYRQHGQRVVEGSG